MLVDAHPKFVLREAGRDEALHRPFDRFFGVRQPARATRQTLGVGPIRLGKQAAKAGTVVARVPVGWIVDRGQFGGGDDPE